MNGSDRPTWYYGPVDPDDLKPYFEWLLSEFQGSLVEGIQGDHYHVEVTKLEEDLNGKFRPAEGRNARIQDTAIDQEGDR